MLASAVSVAVLILALVGFAAIAVTGARRIGPGDADGYLTARATQGTVPLALSFFASALGTWILLSPPEVGTFSGSLGIVGYGVGQALAIAVFAYVGPRIREARPVGTTILEYVRARFGRTQQAYAGVVSVAYMFLFLTAELTAVALVFELLADVDPVVPVVAVAGITAAYTAYGGLPASLATDRWQGWLILVLVAIGGIAVGIDVGDPAELAVAGGATSITRVGGETFVVLVIAIVSANLFHQGFWQRVWAARDERVLVRAPIAAGALILPVVLLLGISGAVAGGRGVEQPSVAFFSLVAGLPDAVVALVVLLAVALVASTADTLQNALTSLIAVHVGKGRVTFGHARAATILLTVPAAVIAIQGLSVLRLFLIADLLAATVVVPVFLGIWSRVTARAALAGSLAGLGSVIVLGWITSESVVGGLRLLTLPEGPSLGAFVVAPVASATVTVAVSLYRAGRGISSRP